MFDRAGGSLGGLERGFEEAAGVVVVEVAAGCAGLRFGEPIRSVAAGSGFDAAAKGKYPPFELASSSSSSSSSLSSSPSDARSASVDLAFFPGGGRRNAWLRASAEGGSSPESESERPSCSKVSSYCSCFDEATISAAPAATGAFLVEPLDPLRPRDRGCCCRDPVTLLCVTVAEDGVLEIGGTPDFGSSMTGEAGTSEDNGNDGLPRRTAVVVDPDCNFDSRIRVSFAAGYTFRS